MSSKELDSQVKTLAAASADWRIVGLNNLQYRDDCKTLFKKIKNSISNKNTEWLENVKKQLISASAREAQQDEPLSDLIKAITNKIKEDGIKSKANQNEGHQNINE